MSGSKRKRGFTPKLRVEVRCPRGLGTTTIFPKSQPPWQGDRKPEWSAQTESPTVTRGTIHSTKIPTGKSGPPQKMDQFVRNFSGWTEPIHWVLDRNFRKFWSNEARPKVLASKPASTFGSNACTDLGYGWTRARPSASTPTRMLPNAIKALHNPDRGWQHSCSWSLTTLNYI